MGWKWWVVAVPTFFWLCVALGGGFQYVIAQATNVDVVDFEPITTECDESCMRGRYGGKMPPGAVDYPTYELEDEVGFKAFGKDPEGNYIPIMVDSKGRVVCSPGEGE